MNKRPPHIFAFFVVLILCIMPRFTLAQLIKGLDQNETEAKSEKSPSPKAKTPSFNSSARIEELKKKIAKWQRLDTTTVKPFDSVKQARKVLEEYKKRMGRLRNNITAADLKLSNEIAKDIREFNKDYGDIESAIKEYNTKHKDFRNLDEKLKDTERLKEYYENRTKLESKVKSKKDTLKRKREEQLTNLERDINKMNERLEWVEAHSDDPIFKRELASLANETRIAEAKRELEDLKRLKKDRVENDILSTDEVTEFEEVMKKGSERRENRKIGSTDKAEDQSILNHLEDDYWYLENVDKNADEWADRQLDNYKEELEFMDITDPELKGDDLERKKRLKFNEKKKELIQKRNKMVEEAREYLNKRINIANKVLENIKTNQDPEEQYRQRLSGLEESENEAAQRHDTLFQPPRLGMMTGEWKTDYNDMKLTEMSGGKVRGVFDWSNGRIDAMRQGTDGRILKGFWIQDSSNSKCNRPYPNEDQSFYWGRIEFKFNQDFTEFNGIWSYCEEELSGTWNGWEGKRSNSINIIDAETDDQLDEIAVGESFRVKLIFGQDPGPGVEREPIIIRNTRRGDPITVFAEPEPGGDHRVFLTDPIKVVSPQQSPPVEP